MSLALHLATKFFLSGPLSSEVLSARPRCRGTCWAQWCMMLVRAMMRTPGTIQLLSKPMTRLKSLAGV